MVRKVKRYRVFAGGGTFLIEGDLRKCRAYIKQAIQKGADPDFLTIKHFWKEVQPCTQ